MGGVCALLTVLARCEWSVAPCRGELSLGYSRAKRPEPGASTGTKAHGFAKRKWSVAPRMPGLGCLCTQGTASQRRVEVRLLAFPVGHVDWASRAPSSQLSRDASGALAPRGCESSLAPLRAKWHVRNAKVLGTTTR